jgi:exonuclease SbcD
VGYVEDPVSITAPMPRLVTILHTADVHLGSSQLAREERAFERSVDKAIDLDVDAVVVAGDLFDHARVDEDLLDWTAAQLNRLERPVVVLTGNHDTLHGASVYHRLRLAERCPDAVLLEDVDGGVVDVEGTDLSVWGRAMVEHEPAFHPLAGAPGRPEGRWLVVAAHGLVVGAVRDPYRSSPIPEEMIDDLECDYVALGHRHAYEEVRDGPTPAIYSGATASSRSGEAGAVVVELLPEVGARPRWVGLEV